MLEPANENIFEKMGIVNRDSISKPIVPLEDRPSVTSIPTLVFPDLNETDVSDANVTETSPEDSDFSCRRLSIRKC